MILIYATSIFDTCPAKIHRRAVQQCFVSLLDSWTVDTFHLENNPLSMGAKEVLQEAGAGAGRNSLVPQFHDQSYLAGMYCDEI